MLKVPQILVRAITLVGAAALLAACGQKGALIRPTEPAARQRASLIQSVKPDWARSPTPTPAAGAPAAAKPQVNTPPPTPADLVPESTMTQDE